MIHLDYRDARPIYTQIIDGFKEQISTGVLQSGEKLPSVRELAGHQPQHHPAGLPLSGSGGLDCHGARQGLLRVQCRRHPGAGAAALVPRL